MDYCASGLLRFTGKFGSWQGTAQIPFGHSQLEPLDRRWFEIVFPGNLPFRTIVSTASSSLTNYH
jgi:hypothetical protein